MSAAPMHRHRELVGGEIRVEQHEFLSRQEIARNRQRHQRCQVGAPHDGRKRKEG